MARSPNKLLASLKADEFAAIEPHLKLVDLKLGDVIAETGSTVRRVYFPNSGAISLVVELGPDQIIETAIVGYDGAVNAASALDGKISFNKAIVQLAGTASVIAADQLRNFADNTNRFAPRSFITSKCCLHRRNSRSPATQLIPWRPECAAGCCAWAIWRKATN